MESNVVLLKNIIYGTVMVDNLESFAYFNLFNVLSGNDINGKLNKRNHLIINTLMNFTNY